MITIEDLKKHHKNGVPVLWEIVDHEQIKMASRVTISFVGPSHFSVNIILKDGTYITIHSAYKCGERDVLSELTELSDKEITDDPGC